MSLASHDLRIGTLRVQRSAAHTGDETALRVTVSRLLGGADLYPRGIPPSAVLIVQQLSDPLPGKLAAQATSIRPDPLWEAAVQAALVERYQHATRPERGRIRGTPEAVVFADESEMLACLSLDLAAGSAHTRWWWQLPLRRTGSDLPALLAEQIAYLPAVLHHLTRWAAADSVMNALTDDAALALFNLMAEAIGLREPSIEESHAEESDAVQLADDPRREPTAEADRVRRQSSRAAAILPAWQGVVSAQSISSRLSKTRQLLLGTALTAFRAPALARSVAFSRQIIRWWTAEIAETAPDRDRRPEVSHSTPPAIEPTKPVDRERAHIAPDTLQKPASTTERLDRAVPPESSAIPPRPVAQETRAHQQDSISPAATTGTHEGAETPLFSRLAFWAEGVETRLGGVLYLINAMIALDLPACLEGSARLASQVGAWGVLDVLGRALLAEMGVPDAEYAADPLWTALALLDGRQPGTPPGTAFVGDEQYLIPAAWAGLTPHPHPLSHKGRGETTPYVPPLSPHAEKGESDEVDSPSPTLSGSEGGVHWLTVVMPYVRGWLCAALNVTPNALPATLRLTLPGRLYITATHVDLVMRLDAISLAVRLAGLDRDPGWVFGRVIKFYFE